MTELVFSESSFIHGEYISLDLCDELVDYFNYNKKYANKGTIINTKNNEEESIVKEEIKEEIKESLDLGVSAGNFDNVIGQYRHENDKVLKNYLEKFKYANEVHSFNIVEGYNIQYYPVNGGFKKWHCENAGENIISIKRHLVFMTYLNDVEDGGTEFFHQNIKTEAKKGLTLIWPSAWTHYHRGIVSSTKEKYIITGWYSFIK